ncbi:MAG: ATP-binding protein [Acidimicrobiaceae bacterium]|nr:ATP-binding protein [Acidimicrobiaceae bacterium]MYE75987.1 ATP-binding protein [Acidimicrobiaceae bacterium]MYJ43246.1 ATP-binding protein [Acidimicrobiaceae bacterium]MYJ80601.1 ATP-binding protein [Acidimicrobiaceae bacterium]
MLLGVDREPNSETTADEALVERPTDAHALQAAMARSPVTLLTGPRQTGKSTLVRRVVNPSPSSVFDLEDYRDLARLAEPMLALRDAGETIVIDEAQRMPELFKSLRVLVDEARRPGRFVVLGSASPDLTGLSSESLAGRVTMLELSGFRLGDVGADRLDDLWLRGGLPESFLAVDDQASSAWRDDYIATFLERDLAGFGFRFPATTMRRFWTMLAHYHGQTWNGAAIARSIDVSEAMVRRLVDALTDALVVRQLPAWFANISKRQVKAPRVHVRDCGLLHRLLGIGSRLDLDRHPKMGASWEGMVLEQLLARFGNSAAAFWSTHGGAELDLRLEIDGQVIGFEIKRTDRPSTSKSMHSALADLELDHLVVVHAAAHRFTLADRITAIGATELLVSDDPLSGL